MKTAMGSRMEADATADGPEWRPRLTLASAVMFVADLDRSVDFYQQLLGLEATARDDDAALLVSPDGYQLYLRSMGRRARRYNATIGIQYLIWTAESEEDLERCEQVLRAHSSRVTSTAADGFRVVEGQGPDGVPVVVTFPGPDQAPRREILKRIYLW
jgi:catechol 2,3-dioxygenase-like lactoylglutathione lyase family enzyme